MYIIWFSMQKIKRRALKLSRIFENIGSCDTDYSNQCLWSLIFRRWYIVLVRYKVYLVCTLCLWSLFIRRWYIVLAKYKIYLVCNYCLWFIWLLRSTWVCGDLYLKLFDMMFGFPCDEAGSNHIIEILWNMTLCTNSPSESNDKKRVQYNQSPSILLEEQSYLLLRYLHTLNTASLFSILS